MVENGENTTTKLASTLTTHSTIYKTLLFALSVLVFLSNFLRVFFTLSLDSFEGMETTLRIKTVEISHSMSPHHCDELLYEGRWDETFFLTHDGCV